MNHETYATLPLPASAPDLKHVRLDREMDVQYWSRRFRTSRQCLEEAVEQVGHHVNAIADYLERRQRTRS